MVTILFDIDGTLIRSGGAGMNAINEVMKNLFDVDSVAKIKVHGRTDNGILSDVFAAHSLDYDAHRDDFNAGYWGLLPQRLKECDGEILPGAVSLLEHLHGREKVALGILTGNSKRAAQIKLEHFGLDGYFEFGGYGDHHSERNDVAGLARAAAEEFLGQRFVGDQLWVVGDTVNDITCARSIQSRVVAVETGGSDPDVLRAASPDLQLKNLDEIEAFVSNVIL
ncbi:MAG: HAD family hydrolase [Mariniblastus sp.]